MKRVQMIDQSIRSIASREREALGELIGKLRELDVCRGYLELGYPSLFDYLTKSVGYSAGSAQRRIDAARLCKDVPELKEKLQAGSLDLHHVATVSKAIRQTKKTRMVSALEKKRILAQVQKQSEGKTQQLVADFFDLTVLTETKRSVQKDNSVRLEITISREVADLIEKAQGLVAHAVPTKDLAAFLEYVAKRIIKQKAEPARKRTSPNNCGNSRRTAKMAVKDRQELPLVRDSQTTATVKISVNSKVTKQSGECGLDRWTGDHNFSKTREPLPSPTPIIANSTQETEDALRSKTSIRQSQAIKQSLHRQIRHRQPACVKCGSKWFLQTDHKTSRWVGGKDALHNLQTLCGPCNRFKYKKESGVKFL